MCIIRSEGTWVHFYSQFFSWERLEFLHLELVNQRSILSCINYFIFSIPLFILESFSNIKLHIYDVFVFECSLIIDLWWYVLNKLSSFPLLLSLFLSLSHSLFLFLSLSLFSLFLSLSHSPFLFLSLSLSLSLSIPFSVKHSYPQMIEPAESCCCTSWKHFVPSTFHDVNSNSIFFLFKNDILTQGFFTYQFLW